ncbi:MAG: glycosyltransferase [Bryobacterales bacterium]|nr:glycosyltransferase [Bryobacterales bacterium]
MRPGTEQVAAVIVTYHPPATLPTLVNAIRSQVGRVLVIDNAPRSCELRDVDVISNPSNLGQAAALNQGCEWAQRNGFPWVLFLDQDTVVLPDLISGLAAGWQPGVALIGAGRQGVHKGSGTRDVPFVITSGSLLWLNAFAAVGPFRSDFFIDWVDHEYCWRLKTKGWRVLLSLRPGVVHQWGNPERVHLLGIPIWIENYPPLRRYYIVRNWVYVCTRYAARLPGYSLLFLGALVKQMTKVIVCEPRRREKARAAWLGLCDGLRGRLGPAPF